MNLPNKLTVMRVIMVPFFVVLMLVPICGQPCEGWCKWVALALLCFAPGLATWLPQVLK